PTRWRETPCYAAPRLAPDGIELRADPQAVADGGDLVEDRGRDREGLGGRHLGEVGGDVVGRQRAARFRQPAFGQAHEHAGEAAGARRVVVVGEGARTTG